MASVQTHPASQPELPDYLTDPNAVLKDHQAKWRYGRAPDYSKTRKVFEESESCFAFPPFRLVHAILFLSTGPLPSVFFTSFPKPSLARSNF